MQFFEQELRKIISPIYPDVTYVGRVCYVPLCDVVRAKVEFFYTNTINHYDALKVTILNRTNGQIDVILLRFFDIFGKKQVNNPNFPNGIVPHVLENGFDIGWYVYKLTTGDYTIIQNSIKDYFSVFK